VAFSDARYEFENHAIDISLNEESVIYGKTLVLTPDLEVFDYLTPLHFFGETLDDEEIVVKEMVLDMLTEHSKSFRSADLQRESDNSYTMTIDTEEEEQIFIQIEYHPNIDALRLVAENNGEHGLLFEYVNTGDGYAAQYYFNSVVGVGGTYGVQEKTMAMCVYKTIFSGKEGSCARFDDVEEPASLLNGVPDEQAFIEGATHWFTLKDDKLTGELDGITF
ncbi:MAG: hypothetical protein GX949_02800, partial [Peptococcaceae bacterium]|nr:hypothetical protein [Peptococcaceae bacterium]